MSRQCHPLPRQMCSIRTEAIRCLKLEKVWVIGVVPFEIVGDVLAEPLTNVLHDACHKRLHARQSITSLSYVKNYFWVLAARRSVRYWRQQRAHQT
jgi:hypothetical protein